MTNILFSPPPGLFMDDTAMAVDGRWVDASNVRFREGKPEVIGGWDTRVLTGAAFAGNVRNIHQWTSGAGTEYIAYGTTGTARLFVETSGVLYDITPAGVTSTRGWSLAPYGITLLANPATGTLYQWSNNTGVVAAEITQAPDIINCMLVTNERQVLAFGCNEEVSGTFNGSCIRGSDIEDPTNWTSTATNNAFEHILEGSDRIVAARLVGAFVGIWTDSELWVGQFLGNPGQTYSFERVGMNCGSRGFNAVVVAGQTAYWITPDLQPFSWTPGGVPQPMDCPLLKTFQGAMNTSKTAAIKSHAGYVAEYNEVWFWYPVGSSSSTEPTRAIAVSLDTGLWFRGSYLNGLTAFYQAHDDVIAGNGAGALNMETGKTGTTGSNDGLTWYIESGWYYIDKAQRRLMLRTIWPDPKDQSGDVTLTIKTAEYPKATATSQTALTLTTSTTKKDFRYSGRLFKVRFSGDDVSGTTDTYMRLGVPIFDAVPTGRR